MNNKQRWGVPLIVIGLPLALFVMWFPVLEVGVEKGGYTIPECGNVWRYVTARERIIPSDCRDFLGAMAIVAVVLLGLSFLGLAMALFGRKTESGRL